MFNERDLTYCRALKKVLSSTDVNFDVKGEAVIALAAMLNWFNLLEKIIVTDLTPIDTNISEIPPSEKILPKTARKTVKPMKESLNG